MAIKDEGLLVGNICGFLQELGLDTESAGADPRIAGLPGCWLRDVSAPAAAPTRADGADHIAHAAVAPTRQLALRPRCPQLPRTCL